MSDSSPGALRLLLALGYGGGAVLLLLLLTKDNAEALTARVGYTAVSVIVLGLVAAAGARLFDRSELPSLWGWATLLIAIVTFVLVMVEIWPDDPYPNETRTLVMIAISLLLGGGSLVLSGEADEADQATRIASRVALTALVALGVLTVLIASEVEIGVRWFGVASAVFLISALSLPVLRLATERDDAF
jgi:cytochrome bd-type quinol oxidase subunit 2